MLEVGRMSSGQGYRAEWQNDSSTALAAAEMRINRSCTRSLNSSFLQSNSAIFVTRNRADGGTVDDEAVDDEAADDESASGVAENVTATRCFNRIWEILLLRPYIIDNTKN